MSAFIHWLKKPEDQSGSHFLVMLQSVEVALTRMIDGVFRFVWRQLPQWLGRLCRCFAEYLNSVARLVVRVIVRLSRITVLFTFWLAIVLGPLMIWESTLTAVWMIIAFVGSGYGLYRHRRLGRSASETIVQA